MKRIKRMASLILALLLLSAPTALADIQRGDRGEDVAELQQLLFETGWLFELPDGIFGRNTEEAVKGFERYANLPVDGIADDLMIYELAVSLDVLNEEHGIVSEYFGESAIDYFTGAPGDGEYGESKETDGGTDYAECCIQSTDVDGSSHIDYCEVHHALHVETYRMLESGDPELAQYASGMWYEEVSNLYERWASLLSEEAQGGILANRATFLASVEAQRMTASFGEQTDSRKIKTEAGICQTLRNQASWLCGMIWEQQSGETDSEQDGMREAVVLNASTIIDGNKIYYADEIEGEGSGIYVMNADGSDRRKISDIQATLKAASNGNLLIWHYDDGDDGAMKILREDGTLEMVAYSNCRAIARDGRFYYGGSSVAEDGSDHQWLLSSDPEYHDNYHPLDVVDGYLYYIDTNCSGIPGSYEEGFFPSGDVELNRLNLETGEIELLSGVGTNYIGIEDGMLYYTRENFGIYDEVSGGAFTIEVDEGLYSMNLEALAETMIAEFTDDLLIFEYYTLLQDGVVYGDYSDYNPDEAVYRIMRRRVNGAELPAVDLGNCDTCLLYVKDGVAYGVQSEFVEIGEYYSYKEYLLMYNLNTGEQKRLAIDEDEAFYYTEMKPRIAVVDGRIYYYVMNEADGAESLRSMALDGSDVRTLVKSAPRY